MSAETRESSDPGPNLPRHAFLIFTGTGPILVLSTYPEADDPHLVSSFRSRGILKYIAYEVSLEAVQARYGENYERVVESLGSVEDVRILDFNGHQIMTNFSLTELGEPIKVGG